MFRRERTILAVLKISVVLPLLYAAISGFLHPADWVSFIPSFSNKFIDPFLALKLFGTFEIIVSIMILWGKWLTFFASIAALLLFGIVALNWQVKDIFFRDLGLGFSALALALYARGL